TSSPDRKRLNGPSGAPILTASARAKSNFGSSSNSKTLRPVTQLTKHVNWKRNFRGKLKEERMTIFGKPLSAYVDFCKVFLILLPLVGIIRLALSLSGTPNATARWFSMTALAWIAIVYYSIRVHSTGFGSYKQLLVICVLLNLSIQIISITGIVIAILS